MSEASPFCSKGTTGHALALRAIAMAAPASHLSTSPHGAFLDPEHVRRPGRDLGQ